METIQKPNPPRRHHYLPIKYQSGFCRDSLLWLFDRKTTTIRNAHPKNTCLESHYYSLQDKDGNRNTELETVFSKVEGATWPLIEKLEKNEQLSLIERTHLAEFVTLMRFRTPEFERAYNELTEGTMRLRTQHAFSSVEDTEKILNLEPKESRVTAHELYDFVQNDEYKITAHRNASLTSLLHLVSELTPEIMTLWWKVIHADAATSFITTDAPFILLPPKDFKAYGIRGY
jgi:hypothetical protein